MGNVSWNIEGHEASFDHVPKKDRSESLLVAVYKGMKFYPDILA